MNSFLKLVGWDVVRGLLLGWRRRDDVGCGFELYVCCCCWDGGVDVLVGVARGVVCGRWDIGVWRWGGDGIGWD